MVATYLNLEPDQCQDNECHCKPWCVDNEKVLVEGHAMVWLWVPVRMRNDNCGYRASLGDSTTDNTDLCTHVSGPCVPTALVDEWLTGTLGGRSPESLDRL